MNINSFLLTFEYIGVFILVFTDSIPFLSVFLPGGAVLLFTGLFTSIGYFDLTIVSIVSILAAVLGDTSAYFLGKKVGIKVFTKEDSIIFDKKNLARTQHVYEKYGIIIMLIYRFVPFLRNFAAILAGVGEMTFWKFTFLNIIGSIIWVVVTILIGYHLGAYIPQFKTNVNEVFLFILFILLMPSFLLFIKLWKKWRNRRQTISEE